MAINLVRTRIHLIHLSSRQEYLPMYLQVPHIQVNQQPSNNVSTFHPVFDMDSQYSEDAALPRCENEVKTHNEVQTNPIYTSSGPSQSASSIGQDSRSRATDFRAMPSNWQPEEAPRTSFKFFLFPLFLFNLDAICRRV
jgi:hypothetical protein